jgi:Macrocin-O-methyltransferase (TylF)
MQNPIDLYLDLLQKSLTDTVINDEPNIDQPPGSYVVQFTSHYIRGNAVSMLPRERFLNLRECIERVINDGIPGDFIETGVWRGGACIFMRAALEALGVTDRNVWVADSFEGMPVPDRDAYPLEAEFRESPMMTKGFRNLAASLEEVRDNFARYGMLDDRVRFLKGWFKDTLASAPIEKLAVLRLDGDFYESTIDALTALYPKLSVGGFVIVDDYGEDLWTYCRKAIEDFRLEHSVSEAIVRVDNKCVVWRKSKS